MLVLCRMMVWLIVGGRMCRRQVCVLCVFVFMVVFMVVVVVVVVFVFVAVFLSL